MTQVVLVAFLCVAAAAVATGQQAAPPTSAEECRLCPRGCHRVPRADGSCPVCICDGVALTEGPSAAAWNVPAVTVTPRCAPPVGACPEACQQLVGGSGCPECVCDVPKPVCPFIQCPEDCRIVEQEGGCPSCRCDPPGICPAIPECLRGCIDHDEESECFTCNCTTPPSPPNVGKSDPPTFILFPDKRPTTSIVVNDPLTPVGSGHPSSDREYPASQCPKQPFTCPADCRVGITPQGCRECHCGDNAQMCPGVEPCLSRCHIIDTRNGCCTCQCHRMPVKPRPILWKIFRSTFLEPAFNRPQGPWTR
ncbi:uncharacterized protein LOC126993158 [Eriocheir sinensis]|uniref:uncharacterized protein LOC126993158 n=1 Tax=Eriocheir sinensis TaxID=95602 RepID=UPI0021C57030|nr:uncharacterized protein LOC126993158 [Eriocheir sinensis]